MAEHPSPQQVSYREFISQEICEQLSPPEVKRLVYTQMLPELHFNKDVSEVLLELEKLDKFSESNLAPLASMMKAIGRSDLTRKVERYIKKQKHSKNQPDLPANVSIHASKEADLTESITKAKFLAKSLLERMEEIETTANELGHQTLGNEVAAAITIMEQQLQNQLYRVSATFIQQQESADSSQENKQEQCLTIPEDHTYDYMNWTAPRETSRPLQAQTEAGNRFNYSEERRITLNRQGGSRGNTMVIGSERVAQPTRKATDAPRKKQVTASSEDLTAECTGGSEGTSTGDSGGTSTGDSGFVDSKKYRKDFPPPKVPQRYGYYYMPLNPEQREEPASYATASCKAHIQDGAYDEVGFDKDEDFDDEENPYVNVTHHSGGPNSY